MKSTIAVLLGTLIMLSAALVVTEREASAGQWCKEPPKQTVYADGRTWHFVRHYTGDRYHNHVYANYKIDQKRVWHCYEVDKASSQTPAVVSRLNGLLKGYDKEIQQDSDGSLFIADTGLPWPKTTHDHPEFASRSHGPVFADWVNLYDNDHRLIACDGSNNGHPVKGVAKDHRNGVEFNSRVIDYYSNNDGCTSSNTGYDQDGHLIKVGKKSYDFRRHGG